MRTSRKHLGRSFKFEISDVVLPEDTAQGNVLDQLSTGEAIGTDRERVLPIEESETQPKKNPWAGLDGYDVIDPFPTLEGSGSEEAENEGEAADNGNEGS